ncbi:hypothetical protein [Nonomuraea turkmeniaca]
MAVDVVLDGTAAPAARSRRWSVLVSMGTARTSGACWSACGLPPGFDAERYRERNTVERCVNKLRNNRAVALRTDKCKRIYQGTIDVASIRIWLRDPTP